MFWRRFGRLVLGGLVVALPLGIAGCDLANLQAGLEVAPASVVENANQRSANFAPPPAIATYDSFDVAVTDAVSVRVHARERSNARGNVFLIHGAGGGSWVWEEVFDRFPSAYNIYALSWRGHFESTPVEDADSADYVDDQLAVLAEIGRRNPLPVHVIGHSYGGATAVLMAAREDVDIASLQLLAPVVPLDYSLTQRLLVPLIAPAFIGTENDADGVFGGMFLSDVRMRHWYDTYASQPYSEEKPSLIAGDGIAPAWQTELADAYQVLGQRGLPVWITIARYDNAVVPRRQREAAELANANVRTIEAGHYIPLGTEISDVVNDLWSNLASLENATN